MISIQLRPTQPVWGSTQVKNKTKSQTIYPMVIIGGGPAGLSAALTANRLGITPLLIEEASLGGLINNSPHVDNYPGVTARISGYALSERMKGQVEASGGLIQNKKIISLDIQKRPFCLTDAQGQTIYAQTLIIATGASPKMLGLKHEKALLGKGVYTCALCDGPLFQNKPVVVVGGGDSALTDALILAKYASQVTMVVRGDTLRAKPHLIQQVRRENNIKILTQSVITQLNANADNQRQLQNVMIKTPNGDTQVKIPALFLALGHMPNTNWLPKYLKRTETGYLEVDPKTMQTSVPGIYACGEVHDDTYRQVTTATGYGTMAAMQADRFLKNNKN